MLKYSNFTIILFLQVSAHRPWIDCIIRSVSKGYNKDRIDHLCKCVIEQSGDAEMDYEMIEKKCLATLE